MRQVYASPRSENVDRVEAMFNEAGIETRVRKRDKINRGRFQRFSYNEEGDSKDWPAVQVVFAEDMPRARELLRAAGLMGSTRPDAETPIPRWEAPGDRPDDMARRMRRVAMIGVLLGLILLAWAYQTAPSRTSAPAGTSPPVKMRTACPLPTVAAHGRPANDSPMRASVVGAPGARSVKRTAQPSMAELSWAGTSIGETTSAASVRPSACRMWTRSTVVTGSR